jgi:hypothetical protein
MEPKQKDEIQSEKDSAAQQTVAYQVRTTQRCGECTGVECQLSCELKLFLPQLTASEGSRTFWANSETTLLQSRLK